MLLSIFTCLFLSVSIYGTHVYANEGLVEYSVTIYENSPSSGHVVLDENGKLLSYTHESFVDKGESTITPFGQQFFAFGHWTYGSDKINYGWGKIMSFSNFKHNTKTHSATARVGTAQKVTVQPGGYYAYAEVVGDVNYKAEAFYNYW